MSSTPKRASELPGGGRLDAQPRQIVVRATDAVWQLECQGGGGSYATRDDALQAAERMIHATGGEVRIDDGDGRMRRTVTIGRNPFGKISAVEGLNATPEARARTKDFDRRGLTPTQRRSAIIEAHRPGKR